MPLPGNKLPQIYVPFVRHTDAGYGTFEKAVEPLLA